MYAAEGEGRDSQLPSQTGIRASRFCEPVTHLPGLLGGANHMSYTELWNDGESGGDTDRLLGEAAMPKVVKSFGRLKSAGGITILTDKSCITILYLQSSKNQNSMGLTKTDT